MRPAFIDELTKIAQQDPRVVLVTGDMGYAVFESFRDTLPNQFLNVGVAEQNMVSVAAGLAMTGKIVFCYSISTFASMRAFEQIRMDLCYQNLPVCIIGGGSTFSYSTFGCSHMPLEDLGALRILPNMAVACAGDPLEVRALVQAAYRRSGPTYIRIAKRGEPTIHSSTTEIQLGKAIQVMDGRDVTLIVTGRPLPSAVEAAKALLEEGIACRVLSMHTVKPLDVEAILAAVRDTRAIVTIEDHLRIGGLFSAVAETLIEHTAAVPVKSLAVSDEFPKGVGSQDFFLSRYHLTKEGIVDAVHELLAGR